MEAEIAAAPRRPRGRLRREFRARHGRRARRLRLQRAAQNRPRSRVHGRRAASCDRPRQRHSCGLGLYVGPFINARSKSWLTRHKMPTSSATNPRRASTKSSPTARAARRFADAPIADHFDACHAFISEALVGGCAVLVHCQMGKSRSATLAAAYVVKELGVSWRDALARVQRARPTAAPNTGFLKALRAYELAMPLEGPGIAELHRLLDAGVDELALVPGPLHGTGSSRAPTRRPCCARRRRRSPAGRRCCSARRSWPSTCAPRRALREAQAWRRARERGAGDDARGRAANGPRALHARSVLLGLE